MLTLRTCFPVLFCLVFTGTTMTAIPAGAEDIAKHPNYSGRWKMIKDQSDFGKFKAPDMIIRVVDEHEPTLNIHTLQTKDGKTTSSDVSYFIDGRESTNTLGGRDATSKSFWDGSSLTIRTETKNSKGEDTQIVDRWDLSTDGQTLTIASHIETPNGEVDLKLVCEKEKTGS
jgi:hypothetical protein